jgi:predicted transcriptional regulator
MKAAMGVRLSDEALRIIEEESRKQGVTKTAVIEMALRLYAKRRTK